MSKRNYTSAYEYTSKKRKINTCDEEDELDMLINMEKKNIILILNQILILNLNLSCYH